MSCVPVTWHLATKDNTTVNGDNSVEQSLSVFDDGTAAAWIRTEDSLSTNGQSFEFTIDRQGPEFSVELTDYDPSAPFYDQTNKYAIYFALSENFFGTYYQHVLVTPQPDGLFAEADRFKFSWQDDTIVLLQNNVVIFTWPEAPSGSLRFCVWGGTSKDIDGVTFAKVSDVEKCVATVDSGFRDYCAAVNQDVA